MGLRRRCIEYRKVLTKRGEELRCSRLQKSGDTLDSRQPVCAPGLKRGGASPGLMRGSLSSGCKCVNGKKVCARHPASWVAKK